MLQQDDVEAFEIVDKNMQTSQEVTQPKIM